MPSDIKRPLLLSAVLLFAGSLPLLIDCQAAAQLQAMSPTIQSKYLEYFPLQAGDRCRYVKFYASRKPRRSRLIENTFWETVESEDEVHGFRVLVVRLSQGSLTKEEGEWVYGEPDEILEEHIYVLTSKGVELRSILRYPGTERGLLLMRHKALVAMKQMSQGEFILSLKNWVLPFPIRAGVRRDLGFDSAYRILKGGSKTFLPKRYRPGAVAVALELAGEWTTTRWFAPGKGLVLQEDLNLDGDLPKSEYPFKVGVLMGTDSSPK